MEHAEGSAFSLSLSLSSLKTKASPLLSPMHLSSSHPTSLSMLLYPLSLSLSLSLSLPHFPYVLCSFSLGGPCSLYVLSLSSILHILYRTLAFNFLFLSSSSSSSSSC
ncbi:hypothetical protein CFOL_v3_26371 [Cephalotus follicularis]|uniref:Uncharacterized protein n=1 Tax=Cephalotus follicularis TaxID=3775 RepID=A0A1Q3CRQ9_CEPFO|nr:hypothetical protein CFOL_v3_26371 [Cephalotus follicularis]